MLQQSNQKIAVAALYTRLSKDNEQQGDNELTPLKNCSMNAKRYKQKNTKGKTSKENERKVF